MAKTPAWTRKEGKDPKGGLNAKGRASLKAQGQNIKPPVSAKQAAKLNARFLAAVLARISSNCLYTLKRNA